MEAENIKTRITFGRFESGDIGYLYDFNLLKSLAVDSDAEFKDDTFLDIGTIIELEGSRYKITGIRTLFKNKTLNMREAPGINLYGIGELLDSNFEIAYFVEVI